MADTGRLDAMYTNGFFDEATQVIANAIRLFQLGYFDCAFYSLRQSLELSIGVVYINAEPKRLKDWNQLEDGFEMGKMLNELKKNETYFKDIRDKMNPYFERLRMRQQQINKYVHKQGYQSFYLKNRSFDSERREKWIVRVTKDFELALKDCIGAVAMYRLAIDAMPAVLMDEDIMMRSGDFMTMPFSDSFIRKYVGEDIFTTYKQTKRYKELYESLSCWEKQCPAVFDLIHWQHVDRECMNDYISQAHLLSVYDKLAVSIFAISKKISRIFVTCFIEYSSDVQTCNSKTVLGAKYYDELFAERMRNLPNGDMFLSRVLVNNEYTVLEHTEELDENEWCSIETIGKTFGNSIRETEKMMDDILKEARNK